MEPAFLTIEEVARYLGVAERTVYNKVRSGDLPAVRVGRLWRVRTEDLEGWLRPATAATARGPYPSQAEPEPSLATQVRENAPSRRTDLVQLLEGVSEPLKRRIVFVALLTAEIQARGWPAPVIVGGNAVEFYTGGDYATADIDMAGASEPVAEVLAEWGFSREGRHFYDSELGLVLEVAGSGLGPTQLDHVAGVRVAGLTAYVIGIEDLIVDRLCACKFWNDEESCMWAETLVRGAEGLDRPYLEKRAAEEDVADRLAEILGSEPS